MVPGASKKGLTKTLRDLEAAGIVMRRDLSHVVLHIEYELKQDVKDSILALLDQLAECGDALLRGRTSGGSEQIKDGPDQIKGVIRRQFRHHANLPVFLDMLRLCSAAKIKDIQVYARAVFR
jgi:hypothetical protein